MLPPSHTCLSPAPCIYVDFSSLLETRPLARAHTHTLSPHFKLIPITHTLLLFFSHAYVHRMPCHTKKCKKNSSNFSTTLDPLQCMGQHIGSSSIYTSKTPNVLHGTSRCIFMSSLSCEREGWTREGLICKCGEGCAKLRPRRAEKNWVWVGGTPCGKMPMWDSSITSKMPVHCREHQDAFFYKTRVVIDPCRSNPMCKN